MLEGAAAALYARRSGLPSFSRGPTRIQGAASGNHPHAAAGTPLLYEVRIAWQALRANEQQGRQQESGE